MSHVSHSLLVWEKVPNYGNFCFVTIMHVAVAQHGYVGITSLSHLDKYMRRCPPWSVSVTPSHHAPGQAAQSPVLCQMCQESQRQERRRSPRPQSVVWLCKKIFLIKSFLEFHMSLLFRRIPSGASQLRRFWISRSCSWYLTRIMMESWHLPNWRASWEPWECKSRVWNL